VLEKAVVNHYAAARLSEEFSTALRAALDDVLLLELGTLDGLKKRLTARLQELDAKEDQYLELVGSPGWPKEKIRKKLDAIQVERQEIESQIADTGGKLDIGHQYFAAALELLNNPQAFYARGGTSLKKAMNKLLFAKLYVDDGKIADHELAEAACSLVAADTTTRTYYRRSGALSPVYAPAFEDGQNDSSPLTEGAAWGRTTEADLLVAAVAGHGSNKAALVGTAGFEPATPRL